MSGIFQDYANSDGRVRVSAVTKVPVGSANDRGMIVAGNRVIPYLVDAGQSRNFHDGIAFDSATGMLLLGDGTQTPLNISMGGLQVDSRGAVVFADQVGDVIHQGVGLTNAGALAIQAEPIATFIAHLHNNVASTTGPGTFTRASDGLYLGADGSWRVAPDNVPRFEDDRLLMEPAITNKCENWNANPDAALTNMTTSGDAAAVLSRIDDAEELARAGLHNICSSGFAFLLDNSLGSIVSSVQVETTPGNLNPHTLSIFWRGTGQGFIRFSGASNPYQPLPSSYEKWTITTIPEATGRDFVLTIDAGSVCYFVLNGAEESPVVTSPIVTQGAAGSRAADSLEYGVPSWIEDAEGMLVFDIYPQFSSEEFSDVGIQQVIACNGGARFIEHWTPNVTTRNWRFRDNLPNSASVSPVAYARNERLRVATRWKTGLNMQIGVRTGSGAYDWSPATTYSGGFVKTIFSLWDSPLMPAQMQDLIVFNEDEGTAWIEANY